LAVSEGAQASWPTEIALSRQGRLLGIRFESGESLVISAELLRVESPSAEVKGHGPGQETLQWGKRDVAVTRIEPVGNYAVRLHFSDGHNTGIYTWTYLTTLGREADTRLATHLEKLKAAGLDR
jgi:DUF971 family protein